MCIVHFVPTISCMDSTSHYTSRHHTVGVIRDPRHDLSRCLLMGDGREQERGIVGVSHKQDCSSGCVEIMLCLCDARLRLALEAPVSAALPKPPSFVCNRNRKGLGLLCSTIWQRQPKRTSKDALEHVRVCMCVCDNGGYSVQ